PAPASTRFPYTTLFRSRHRTGEEQEHPRALPGTGGRPALSRALLPEWSGHARGGGYHDHFPTAGDHHATGGRTDRQGTRLSGPDPEGGAEPVKKAVIRTL